ncbi:MAG: PEP-CTERM sorting domain-containing protein [Desulfobacter sp.]|nr:MAG: PEP-CTERM sorting domain-containing protein [Desulfobacter sp.]
MKKFLLLMVIFGVILGLSGSASALYVTGGDAASQADADDVLDIVFAFDTSGSMYDELNAVIGSIERIVTSINCPDCDVWVRATLMGITSDYTMGENVRDYVYGVGGTPVSNHSEDNGPAVTDLVNYFNWNDDTTADQDYYKAIVTIGDEGTENGAGVYQDDWDAAYAANQAADAAGIMVFSILGTPFTAAAEGVFSAMAIGGTGGGHTFADTGGTFVKTSSNTIEQDIEDIICTAGGGGTGNEIPEPGTMILFGLGLLGFAGYSRRRK